MPTDGGSELRQETIDEALTSPCKIAQMARQAVGGRTSDLVEVGIGC